MEPQVEVLSQSSSLSNDEFLLAHWGEYHNIGIDPSTSANGLWYGVATISRLLKIIGLFCRI